jgi:hypothetical protein
LQWKKWVEIASTCEVEVRVNSETCSLTEPDVKSGSFGDTKRGRRELGGREINTRLCSGCVKSRLCAAEVKAMPNNVKPLRVFSFHHPPPSCVSTAMQARRPMATTDSNMRPTTNPMAHAGPTSCWSAPFGLDFMSAPLPFFFCLVFWGFLTRSFFRTQTVFLFVFYVFSRRKTRHLHIFLYL